MKELNLPYNFVPLSRAILQPAWADKVSHDHPLKDGLSGEFTLRITVDTPLCVGGKQTKATNQDAGTIYFSTDEGGKPAIPGSAIKGMLRNVLEIATFGHFAQVDNVRMGVRDIAEASNFYSDLMDEKHIHAGWLTYDRGHWYMTPCSIARVEQREIIRHFEIDEDEWNFKDSDNPSNNNLSARARYQLLQGLRQVGFYHKKIENVSENQPVTTVALVDSAQEAGTVSETMFNGFIVVTGQPGKDFTHPKSKHKDFIFYDPRAKERVKVPERIIADFMFIHQDSDEWRYWRNELEQNRADPGIPVFYKKAGSGIHSMGLAMMYKLAYENSVHDAIANTNSAHIRPERPDLAQLMFGRVDESASDGRNNLRGRVNFGLARVEDPNNTLWKTMTEALVLSGPKPTYYPAYIDQNRGGRTKYAYKTLMDSDAELSGWKRYPVRDNYQEPELTQKVRQNKQVQVRLQTVPARTKFTGRVRFHNLLPAELGALLWATNFGGAPLASHGLGAGRSFGFGQVRLDASEIRAIPNRDELKNAVNESSVVDEMCRSAFADLMREFWSKAKVDQSEWLKSPQLVQLLAMADPYVGGREKEWEFPKEPKDFMKAKQGSDRFIRQPYVDPRKYESGAEAKAGEFCVPHPGSFRQRVEALAEERERIRAEEAEAVRRDQEKQMMSASDLALAEFEDVLQPPDWNKTAFQKLKDCALELKKKEDDFFDASQIESLSVLAQGAMEVVERHGKQNSAPGKAVSNLIKRLNK